jgi:diamine N-acetyltransferase
VPDLLVRSATLTDLDHLIPLVREFYSFEKLAFDELHYRKLASVLISDPAVGRLLMGFEGNEIAGYAVVGFGFSMEFGGRDSLLDELYVTQDFRGRGAGSQLISAVEEICHAEEIRALHLEADHFNVRVHEYYKRLGFRDHERHLMTKWL